MLPGSGAWQTLALLLIHPQAHGVVTWLAAPVFQAGQGRPRPPVASWRQARQLEPTGQDPFQPSEFPPPCLSFAASRLKKV